MWIVTWHESTRYKTGSFSESVYHFVYIETNNKKKAFQIKKTKNNPYPYEGLFVVHVSEFTYIYIYIYMFVTFFMLVLFKVKVVKINYATPED